MINLNNSIRILFVGFDDSIKTLIEASGNHGDLIKIRGIVDVDKSISQENPDLKTDIFDTTYLKDIETLKNSNDIIIASDGVLENKDTMTKLQETGLPLIHGPALSLLELLANSNSLLRKEIMESEKLKLELNAILDSTDEAIQVVDKNGIIKYLNKAFTEITRIPPEDRLNRNILDFYEHGAIADALRTQKPVFGKVVTTETNVVVICNASPIFSKGQMDGVVVAFRDITDITKMSKKLHEYEKYISKLTKELKSAGNTTRYSFDNIIGQSDEILKCISIAKKVSESNTTTLIIGESGTGKELFAQAIHNHGPRSSKPFISINCAAIPDQLLESELFGYEKGAFTGATTSKKGKFEIANGGTIFLDEIGDMNVDLQAKLLRVLQEREIEPIGSSMKKRIDVHVISATHTNLVDKIDMGEFRRDLFYRLSIIQIDIPPLRDRKEDIMLIANHLLDLKNSQLNKRCSLSEETSNKLISYSWPGNIRELANVIERAVLLSDSTNIDPALIFLNPLETPKERIPEKTSASINLEENEKQLIEKALKMYGYDVKGKKKAAKELNISLSTLYNKIKIYKIAKK